LWARGHQGVDWDQPLATNSETDSIPLGGHAKLLRPAAGQGVAVPHVHRGVRPPAVEIGPQSPCRLCGAIVQRAR
jgi:hypothetical protein